MGLKSGPHAMLSFLAINHANIYVPDGFSFSLKGLTLGLGEGGQIQANIILESVTNKTDNCAGILSV